MQSVTYVDVFVLLTIIQTIMQTAKTMDADLNGQI